MIRHESIVALSRDHHLGLQFAWKLKRGLKGGVSVRRMLSYINYFWKDHLKTHFKEEETIVFIELMDELCERAINEHREMEALIQNINLLFQKEDIERLAKLSHDHIRFEERELFPHLENSLSEKCLNDIGSILKKMHNHTHPDTYADTFWIGINY